MRVGKLFAICFLLLPGLASSQSDYDPLTTTVKFKYLYSYVNKFYVDDVDAGELTRDAMLAMAQFADSSKAEKLVKKYFVDTLPLTSFNDLFEKLDKMVHDSIDRGDLVDAGIRRMLDELDPHTVYITKEDYKEMNAPLKGNFEGIGIRFQILKDTLLVVNPIPGGPSEKTGIRAGDKIIFVDEENIAGIGLKNSGVRDRLLGDKGTKVSLRIMRRGEGNYLDFDIIRDKIPINSLDAAYMAAPEIGYVKLNNFSGSTMDEFRDAMSDLKEQGMKRLILDLQGNGGGYLGTAIDLADEFLTDEQLIVYTEGRSFPKNDAHATSIGGFESGNLIVLIDESSASASEIVTGAIQDWDRGLVVGRRSFGKGLVQRQIELPDQSAMRLTISRYYTPTGRSIQKPYEDGLEAYRMEKYLRYKTGELISQDSIDLPDSLRFNTLVTKRDVYGGGGIMPDVFVPLDTTGTSDYLSALIRKGHLNTFCLSYVDENRDSLKARFANFSAYKEGFDPDETGIVDDLILFAEKEGLEFDQEGYDESKEVIRLRIKASIASNLWDYSKFYEIINDINPALEKAIKILQSGEYNNMKLALNTD